METKMFCFELTHSQAWALAQFVKRTSHSDCEQKATSDDEAYMMFSAINAVMKGLDEEGVSPR
ncbi:hypothetical protein VW37_004056 [Salmonella enterica subsp. houtenae serovar 51:z4,z23:-]|nr:hypothetical protein [Salmonella enterica subsp. houtenae serovar 51:z4,z23:-]